MRDAEEEKEDTLRGKKIGEVKKSPQVGKKTSSIEKNKTRRTRAFQAAKEPNEKMKAGTKK